MTAARTTVAALILALTLSLTALASPAEAHSSSYCGHGQSGVYTTTTWVRSWNDAYGRHWHKYEHRRWDLWRVHGDVWKRC